MQADIICVGNEILTGLVENSNAGYLARKLWSLGISVRSSAVVADQAEAIGEALNTALEYSEIVILTGGLGPTDDDLSREAVAAHLGLPLVEDKEAVRKLEAFFAGRGYEMPASNRRQACVIEGGILLPNRLGTAPGMLIRLEGRMIILLPGPPNEMTSMFEESVLPALREEKKDTVAMAKTLKCVGIGESLLEQKIKALGSWEYPEISYVARGYEVFLQLKANGNPEQAKAAIRGAEERLRAALGDNIYGSDDDTLTSVVADMLVENNLTLALAESCSGGLLSDTITDVPGSSRFYRGGIVAYSRFAKTELLGVDEDLINSEGLVSEATAKAMALAARMKFNSQVGIGITGVAGPQSDEDNRPPGLVYTAVALENEVYCHELSLLGGRRAVKERASQLTLDLLRRCLL